MDGAITLLLVVAAICLVVLAWAGRKRFPLRIGAGNFFRRKTQVAIVVAGLLIGTAIITSSYVIQSTFDYTVKAAVFRALGAVDEVVFVPSPEGGRLPFSAQVYDNLTRHLADMPDVAGLAPRYQLPGAVVDTTSELFEPTATVIGFDSGRDLGDFVRADGSAWNGAGLGATEAIINAKLATAVEAKVGEGLVVSMGTPRGNAQMSLSVKEIVRDEGRGAWNDNENLFVPLATIQAALGDAGQINTITVANVGGVTQGYLRSDAVVREMAPFLPQSPTFTISKAKADSIDGATRNIDQLSQVFVLLGFFTVIAGVLLIINIFVMLAEERKGEMGVARALGMRRTNLVQSFVSEGLLYALLSSVVGTFTGLLVAGVILWGFSQVFGASAFGGTGFILTWTDSDLINGFAIGFLITMATIVIASWRVSKLNIVRAIRDIPEPVPHRSTRRQVAAGAAIAVLGAPRIRRRPSPAEPVAPGSRARRPRVRSRRPDDAGAPGARRLHRRGRVHRRMGAESMEVLQHRERGHHALHRRGPHARARRSADRPVQQRLNPRGRNPTRAWPHVAARRSDRDRVSDEQEVPHRGDPREHRPRHVHDRHDVGHPSRSQLLDHDDEPARERRLRIARGIGRPDPELGRGLRLLQCHVHQRHREPRDRPGSGSNREQREPLRDPAQQLVDRRAGQLDATVPAPSS